jgi:flagellar basal body-associated protein FliL
MSYWKRLRWIASIVFVVVLLVALVAAILHRLSTDEAGAEDTATEQRVLPPVPAPGKGPSVHNSTGL